MKLKKIAAVAAAMLLTAQMTTIGASAETFWLSANGNYYTDRNLALADGGSALGVDSSTMSAAQIASVNRAAYKSYYYYNPTYSYKYPGTTYNYYPYDYYYYPYSYYYYPSSYYYYPSYYSTSYNRYYPYGYYDNYYYGYGYNYYGYDLNYYAYMSFKERTSGPEGQGPDRQGPQGGPNGQGPDGRPDRVAPAGTPYLTSRKNYAGWDELTQYVDKARPGESISITLNGAATIPDRFLGAIRGKNIVIKFVLPNGCIWTLNGTDIREPRSINAAVEYNINFIPSKLKKKAKSGALATYQLGIGTGFEDIGARVAVTVRLSAARAGKSAYVYRYDNDADKLVAEYEGVVERDGTCTFSATKGGAYLIVVK